MEVGVAARRVCMCVGFPYLDETNVGALLAEALTADVEAVLADETGRVGADAAVQIPVSTHPFRYSILCPIPPSVHQCPPAPHILDQVAYV